MKNIDFTRFYIKEDYNKYSYEFDMENLKKDDKVIDYLDYYKVIYGEMKRIKHLTAIDKVRLITDIKRVVDCRCNMILKNLGYLKEITKKNYPKLQSIKELNNFNELTLISYLLDINLEIIFKARKIRNIVEHEYYVPSVEEIQESFSSCELFLIVLKNMFNSNKLGCFEITSFNAGKSITIQPYKTDEGVGVIDFNGITYRAEDEEYTLLLKYILSRKFNNIPKELFGVSATMPDNHIKCIGIEVIEDDYADLEEELSLKDAFDYI